MRKEEEGKVNKSDGEEVKESEEETRCRVRQGGEEG